MSSDEAVIVVSGLPRSGTELMMQMLDRGGIPVMTDEICHADVDNPRGYYEFETVKKTKEHPSWVRSARGKAVKMVSSLLYDLPHDEQYRVIFQRRDIDEMLDSQEKMLVRLGRSSAPREEIKRADRVHLDRLFDWLSKRAEFKILEVSYNDVLDDLVREVQRLATFLGSELNTVGMLQAIDPTLYRNRTT